MSSRRWRACQEEPALPDVEPHLPLNRRQTLPDCPEASILREKHFEFGSLVTLVQALCLGHLPHRLRIEPEIVADGFVGSLPEREFASGDFSDVFVAKADASSDLSNGLAVPRIPILELIISAYVLPLRLAIGPPIACDSSAVLVSTLAILVGRSRGNEAGQLHHEVVGLYTSDRIPVGTPAFAHEMQMKALRAPWSHAARRAALSDDTTFEAEQVQVRRWREMSTIDKAQPDHGPLPGCGCACARGHSPLLPHCLISRMFSATRDPQARS